MGFVSKLVDCCNKFASKRICTTDEFTKACNKAIEISSKDEDGFINVKDVIKLIYYCIKEVRK